MKGAWEANVRAGAGVWARGSRTGSVEGTGEADVSTRATRVLRHVRANTSTYK